MTSRKFLLLLPRPAKLSTNLKTIRTTWHPNRYVVLFIREKYYSVACSVKARMLQPDYGKSCGRRISYFVSTAFLFVFLNEMNESQFLQMNKIAN